ncbi:hypothetical protein CEXT_331691 [Caerostris extrusa]|uniref:Uncharacterized protein n=1 Tax=Caerostris extrusa TaxID=172846 RepID=A0AAV4TFY9_CAEEX|nr:hypothetical protein CEXT_331691 [Caerostris extrusa]
MSPGEVFVPPGRPLKQVDTLHGKWATRKRLVKPSSIGIHPIEDQLKRSFEKCEGQNSLTFVCEPQNISSNEKKQLDRTFQLLTDFLHRRKREQPTQNPWSVALRAFSFPHPPPLRNFKAIHAMAAEQVIQEMPYKTGFQCH